jgi:site-specific DNA recombinase
MQGMIAEYERAKIIERNRRGKIHRARRSVNVLSGAPYGYFFVRKSDHEPSRYEILESEAGVVRRIFHWYALEQLSLGSIARRLKEEGVPTRTGLCRWDRGTIWGIVRNPAYIWQGLLRQDGVHHQAAPDPQISTDSSPLEIECSPAHA